MAAPTTPLPASEPTHPCVRCGRRVPIDIALCEVCNPLGLKQPAATQVHAIAAGGIVLFVVVLAVLGRFWLGGVGPFEGRVGGVTPGAAGLEVSLTVSNAGSRAASTTCRVLEAARPVGGPGENVQTPTIPGHGRLTFTTTVSAFGADPIDLGVDCQSP